MAGQSAALRSNRSEWALKSYDRSGLQACADCDVGSVLQAGLNVPPDPAFALLDRYERVAAVPQYGRPRRKQHVLLSTQDDIGAACQVGRQAVIRDCQAAHEPVSR